MATAPFQWGFGGQAITSPEQAARKRAVAEALMAQSATPGQNWAEGLADVAAALSGTVLEGRVAEAETAGRERAGGLFADLAVNSDPNSIIAALTSADSAWASPAQTSIASALLNSGLERSDPMYQLQLEQAQLELEAMRNPQMATQDPFTLSEGQIRYDGAGNVIAEGPAPVEQAPALDATTRQAILAADDIVNASQMSITSLERALELNDLAYDGPFAEQRASAAALTGIPGGKETLDLKNVVTSQALESLKAVFGGMPTEGERKILLEIQGSVDQPKAVRDSIYRRAIEAANKRIASNQAKSAGLRSGEYFQPGYGQEPAPALNATSSGIQWSIEP